MNSKAHNTKILLGITGASGMLFVTSFLKTLMSTGVTVHGVISSSGIDVLRMEQGVSPEDLPLVSRWFAYDDIAAPPASGSSDYSAMVVLPCTMGSLAAIAGGLSINLIHRAADVILKEKKRLVLAVRETPFNRTHLINMLAVHDSGGVICPIMPSYYLNPETLQQAAESYSWRLADQLMIDIPNRKRWKNS